MKNIKPLGKTLRFATFHRDGFTCQYCGKRPPEIILEVDHIIPRAEGGTNLAENLITACFDCNRGKRDKNLSNVPKQAKINSELLEEKYEQLKAFYDYQHKVDNRVDEAVDVCLDYWDRIWGVDGSISVNVESAVRQFLKYFSTTEIKEAMSISYAKVGHRRHQGSGVRYMCGVLNTKLKQRREKENG